VATLNRCCAPNEWLVGHRPHQHRSPLGATETLAAAGFS
jgi:hypothetical protein